MNRTLAVAGAVVALAVSATSSTAGPTSSSQLPRLPRAAAPGELSQYGHIRTLVHKGGRYELGFDPALWLVGETANRAAAADGVVRPGEPVANDYYIRDESKKLLTYLVPATARITVLDRRLRAFRISVADLAQVVRGRNPTGRPLFDRARGLGYWILVSGDSVRSIDQQYQP